MWQWRQKLDPVSDHWKYRTFLYSKTQETCQPLQHCCTVRPRRAYNWMRQPRRRFPKSKLSHLLMSVPDKVVVPGLPTRIWQDQHLYTPVSGPIKDPAPPSVTGECRTVSPSFLLCRNPAANECCISCQCESDRYGASVDAAAQEVRSKLRY